MQTHNVTILQASDGHWLYNGETFGHAVQLAPSASSDDWWEVTEEEKEEIERKEQEESERRAQEERHSSPYNGYTE